MSNTDTTSDSTETQRPDNRRIEGEYTFWDCPRCGEAICTWTDCPSCGWYDEAAWNRALLEVETA